MKQTTGFCPTCQRQRYAIGTTVNHLLHLVLTLLTLGLWGFVWLFLWATTLSNYRCTKCGSKVSRVGGYAGRSSVEEDEDSDARPRRR
jgi:hypothetical protein